MSGSSASAIEPAAWYATLPPPELEHATGGALGVALRSFNGTGARMEKPALCENLVCLHQGGAKRVHRWQDGRHDCWDVPFLSVSLMPMFQANRWFTEGPVAFTHLTLSPGLLGRLAREEFDRDPNDLAVVDRIAAVDPLIATLLPALAESLRSAEGGRLFRESLITAIAVRVLARHSTMPPPGAASRAQGGLAGWQLRRVLDYMAAHLHEDVGVAELVQLTGLSRAHFFRAFRQSAGQTPSRYLLMLRLERARELLAEGTESLGGVARQVGFSTFEPFARAFRRNAGMTPAAWRRQHRALQLNGREPPSSRPEG